ncbi:hypothetical protein AQUSIP_17660 [Aquicella siphonis]|uniref:Uncharacterized protein n=1 Tax=Aquicella siphonis TaxID=254247 RepID=A0A5E4PJ53_9COXI|nr:hypothetical protein AQUSIP_17660 [Aquicella siphonis]
MLASIKSPNTSSKASVWYRCAYVTAPRIFLSCFMERLSQASDAAMPQSMH